MGSLYSLFKPYIQICIQCRNHAESVIAYAVFLAVGILNRIEWNKDFSISEINVLPRPYTDDIWDVHIHIPDITKKLTSVYYRTVNC